MAYSISHPRAVVLLALSACLTAGSFTLTGQTLFLDNIPYYLPAIPANTVPPLNSLRSLNSAGGLVPVTVLGTATTNLSSSTLESIIDGFKTDDVWNEGFLDGKVTPKLRILASSSRFQCHMPDDAPLILLYIFLPLLEI